MKVAAIGVALALAAIGAGATAPCFAGSGGAAACCKTCRSGKACGDTCIAREKVCRKGPGCACDG